MEELLHASEQQLEMAVRHAGITLFTQDRDLRYTWVRNAVMHAAADILGRTDDDLWDAGDAATLTAMKRRVIDGGGAVRSEVRLRNPNGDAVCFDFTVAPLFDRSGAIVGVIGTASDITQSVAARNQMRVFGEEQAIVGEIGREALERKPLRELFALAARRVREVLRAGRVVILERDGIAATDGDEALNDDGAAMSAFAGADAIVIDDVPLRPSGIRSMLAVPVRGAGHDAAIAVIAAYHRHAYVIRENDVAFVRSVANTLAAAIGRVAAEDQLRDAERLASLGHLAASMAHEFNNVLMAISPFAELMRKAAPANPAVADAAAHVANAISRGKRITGEVLRFVSPGQPSLKIVDVESLLVKVANSLRTLPPSISIRLELPPRPIHVSIDVAQIEQVLLNLVMNARDAMAEEGGTIVLGAALDGRRCDIRVRDSGPGIAPHVMPRIFEPFFTTKRSGTGLGLAVARQIIVNHGGELTAENRGGAVFHVVLPAVRAETGAVAAPVPAKTIRVHNALVIEDDAAVAFGVRTLLEILDVKATIASTGADALSMLDAVDPDVILLDVGLPDRDGREVYEEIAARRPDVPVIFSTGHADAALLESLAGKPNVRCLTKPYALEVLEDALAGLSASSAERPEL